MTQAGEVFAVTGMTGRLGSRVAERLRAAGAELRAVVRDASRMPADVPVRPASYDDRAAMMQALEGTTTLFLVSARESANRVHEHLSAVDAAVDAGVQRIVYVSFMSAAPDCTFTLGRDHWHTEQHIRRSGLRFTFLRNSIYQWMLPVFAGADGIIRGPAGDGKVSAVAHEDVADAAATVLLQGNDHDGVTYEVTGPTAMTLAEAADVISEVSGRQVTYHPETLEEAYESRAPSGAPAFEIAGWVTSYVAIATGELSVVSDTVECLTGHPPQKLDDFLRANPESWRHLARD